ncbi:transglutaminase domain-containing protein [Candidatus Roizmanbacteria bacterium]|nr:transglutaminase domain-containing protein [Candidatus Roizmanbacteria bacterium]
MKQKVLDHYLEYGLFTNPGLYENYLKMLPDEVIELGLLLRKNFIHRTTLAAGNVGTNADLKYGDMTKVPWYRQAEDDNLTTTAAMLAEIFRRDSKGFTKDRKVEDKIVLTCRHVSILMASILKAKGIPARVRAGFAGYFEGEKVAWDHWITQYWKAKEERWVTIDVDGSLHRTGFDMYDIPEGKFEWSSDAWLAVRQSTRDGNYFNNAGGFKGLITIVWQLFWDFHCLMNNEIIYLHHPELATLQNFSKNSEEKLQEIDELAKLMQNPDNNFEKLLKIWETKKEFRLLKGALL